MDEVGVISQAPAAVVALHPVRSQLLSELREPLSAAALAQQTGLSRQKVNYHLRAMEAQGLVTLAGTKQWGGLTGVSWWRRRRRLSSPRSARRGFGRPSTQQGSPFSELPLGAGGTGGARGG